MSKHSPGPWERGDSGWFYDANGKAIVYSDGEVVSCGPEDERLIAAAPELLAALISTEEILEDEYWSTTKRVLRELIAKATGERP